VRQEACCPAHGRRWDPGLLSAEAPLDDQEGSQPGPGSRSPGAIFSAAAPDKRWVADITYVRTWQGPIYLSFVLDLFSRRIVGWSMRNDLRTELVLEALNMAVANRKPSPGLIHHSDQGSQLRFKESSQHCLVRPILRVGRAPRRESSSQGSFGVAS